MELSILTNNNLIFFFCIKSTCYSSKSMLHLLLHLTPAPYCIIHVIVLIFDVDSYQCWGEIFLQRWCARAHEREREKRERERETDRQRDRERKSKKQVTCIQNGREGGRGGAGISYPVSKGLRTIIPLFTYIEINTYKYYKGLTLFILHAVLTRRTVRSLGHYIVYRNPISFWSLSWRKERRTRCLQEFWRRIILGRFRIYFLRQVHVEQFRSGTNQISHSVVVDLEFCFLSATVVIGHSWLHCTMED